MQLPASAQVHLTVAAPGSSLPAGLLCWVWGPPGETRMLLPHWGPSWPFQTRSRSQVPGDKSFGAGDTIHPTAESQATHLPRQGTGLYDPRATVTTPALHHPVPGRATARCGPRAPPCVRLGAVQKEAPAQTLRSGSHPGRIRSPAGGRGRSERLTLRQAAPCCSATPRPRGATQEHNSGACSGWARACRPGGRLPREGCGSLQVAPSGSPALSHAGSDPFQIPGFVSAFFGCLVSFSIV